MMMKVLLVATVAAMISTQPLRADDQYIEPNDEGQIEFMTPSGNIGCIYTPEGGTDVYETEDDEAELSCDRVTPKYVRVVLGEGDDAIRYNDVGDASCCGGETLEYGNSIEMGPFVCEVEVTGLTCEREDNDTGFFMSKAKIKLY